MGVCANTPRDPIAWRASLVSQCLESGESSVSSRNYEKALTQYEHGLRVVPTHTELNAGKLATQRFAPTALAHPSRRICWSRLSSGKHAELGSCRRFRMQSESRVLALIAWQKS